MTQDEIIRMAREAGFLKDEIYEDVYEGNALDFERFAALVAEAKDKEIAAKQAEIDRLMLEYCPNEMSVEQIVNWSNHQRSIEK